MSAFLRAPRVAVVALPCLLAVAAMEFAFSVMACLARGSSLGTCLVTAPASSRTPSRAGAALELRRPLGQSLDERDHFLHPLSQLRLGLLRTLGEGGHERVL